MTTPQHELALLLLDNPGLLSIDNISEQTRLSRQTVLKSLREIGAVNLGAGRRQFGRWRLPTDEERGRS